MTDKVLIVTEPDDVLIDGVRILLVDLFPEQSQLVSKALTDIETIPDVVVYAWKVGDPIEWLFDKSRKSQLIIFNAESTDQTLVGYFAAKSISCYFGNLRSLNLVNRSVLYSIEQCREILIKKFNAYEQ
jgi:hypothetical protein